MKRLVPLLLLPLAGCIASVPCEVPAGAGLRVPPVEGEFLATDPGQPWQTVALAHHGVLANATVDLDGAGSVGPVAPGAALQRVEVPGQAGPARLDWLVTEQSAACRAGRAGHVEWSLQAPAAGDVAGAGKGVRAWYAGFWENGTLFDTNIASLDSSDWPRAGWYAAESFEPLPVYVYDESPSERLPVWSPGTRGTPAGPATGNATLWSYFVTIKGFNDGLKGLSTSTVRVVWMPAKDAYPSPTSRPLPGGLADAPLVFLVKLAAVEDAPCAGMPQECAAGSGLFASGLGAGSPPVPSSPRLPPGKA